MDSDRLELVADTVVTAGTAGPHFAFLTPNTPISLRVWMISALLPCDKRAGAAAQYLTRTRNRPDGGAVRPT